MKKQLRFSLLGIFQTWDYEYGITRHKLFGITIMKRWCYDSYYDNTKDRGFCK